MTLLRPLALALALVLALALARPARAASDFTDTWWNPLEPGWGVNFTQQNAFLFVTFYLYDTNGRPTWLTAQMQREVTAGPDRFSGPLVRSTGTWFGSGTWNGAQSAQVGTAIFQSTSVNTGTLSYTVDGITVTKPVERIVLQAINVSGLYVGSVSGRRTGCAVSGAIVDPVNLDVVQSANGAIRIDQVSRTSGEVICRMEGTAVQWGKLLLVDPATYVCQDGWNTPARVYNLRPTPAGIEGQWTSNAGNGCSESGQFAGVTRSP